MNLLPQPRHLTASDGVFTASDRQFILLDSRAPQGLRYSAERLQQALQSRFGFAWDIVASTATPPDQIALILRVAPDKVQRAEGYELSITPDKITIEAHDDAGIFYGICTLIQIVDQSGPQLACLQISDWPDFAARGVMLDISRDKVPTLETVMGLVDLLAGWKVNQFQLYTEHTFAYRNHPEIWANASPFTGHEIMELDTYCRQRFVDLVPNQNSFGHMTRWLTHPRYQSLAETLEPVTAPWGTMEAPFSLCPGDPGSLELVRSLYDELLPHFSSRMFNVGCDETFDVGQGRSKEACATSGSGRVYLDFLLKIYQEVKARDRNMQFWGDIIVEHPDLVPALPKDMIALEWGYEADHPFDQHGARFAAAGIPFYVCPGTSSWTSIGGRTTNALGNLSNAAENGLKHGAIGYLNTDWGDRGHWQTLPISYLGLAVGAAYSWALEANRSLDVAQAVSWHAFRDPTGTMGCVAQDLGNVYRAAEFVPHNASVLFWILQRPLPEIAQRYPSLSPATLNRALEAINQAIEPMAKAQMGRPDAGLVLREFASSARLLRHAARRGMLALSPGDGKAASLKRELDRDIAEIIADYRHVWLARNRVGGLGDSLARLEAVRADYR
jgi:hexosaminidase